MIRDEERNPLFDRQTNRMRTSNDLKRTRQKNVERMEKKYGNVIMVVYRTDHVAV